MVVGEAGAVTAAAPGTGTATAVTGAADSAVTSTLPAPEGRAETAAFLLAAAVMTAWAHWTWAFSRSRCPKVGTPGYAKNGGMLLGIIIWGQLCIMGAIMGMGT